MKSSKIYVFGEVLFDHFPDGKRVLGGAPFNLAWHLQAFLQEPCLISRIGKDAEGRSIRAAMSDWGMTTDFLQCDDSRPTGRVDIHIKDGEPSYDIVPSCAYDFIESGTIEAGTMDLRDCDLLYHGSLALRNAVSAKALSDLKKHFKGTLFMDVNLRPPWWEKKQVLSWMRAAHWVKLNEAELHMLCPGDGTLLARAQACRRSCDLVGLLVTRGAQGALAVTADLPPIQVTPSSQGTLVDTVGAGDAFSAVVILGLVRGWPLEKTMQRAQSFAAAMVCRRGATVSNKAFYTPYLSDYQLAE